jgi:imidazolonepropionase-like amidohydrolase
MVTALVDGNVFLPDGRVARGSVLLDGDRIAAVGEVESPPEARRVDVKGKFVLPGLIDAHTHMSHGYDGVVTDSEGSQGVRASAAAIRVLRTGITTIREVGCYRRVDIALRNAINRGLVPGPRMLCAGQYLAITGGHGHPKGRACDGVDEVRKGAREQLLAGADFIKMMCSGGAARSDESAQAVQFTADEIRAAAEEAAFAGKALAVHAHPASQIKNAVKAGATSIEHGTFLDEEAAELMVEHNAFLVPTLAVYEYIAKSENWPELRDRAAWMFDTKLKTLRVALEKGVRWAVGTDASQFCPIEQISHELVLLQEVTGMSRSDLLLKVTAENAELLSLKDVGAIKPGNYADLIVVDRDPTQDLTALAEVPMTIKGGVVFDWPHIAGIYPAQGH